MLHEGWKQEGSCQQMPVEEALVTFFPAHYDNAGVNAAKRICRDCVVLPECREYVEQMPIHDGIVAGLSAKQRRALHIEYDISYGADIRAHDRFKLSLED